MRNQWIVSPALAFALALTLALATSGALAADETPRMTTSGAAAAYLDTAGAAPPNWRKTPDRLEYLRDPAGCAAACGGPSRFRGPDRASVERDYIDALNLVTYGDMDVKFTGDRVKLKVRF